MPKEQEKLDHSIKSYLPILVAVCIAIGILAGFKIQNKYFASSNDSSKSLGKFDELLRYLETQYVRDVSSEDLTELSLVKVLEDLDPHSKYYSASDLFLCWIFKVLNVKSFYFLLTLNINK